MPPPTAPRVRHAPKISSAIGSSHVNKLVDLDGSSTKTPKATATDDMLLSTDGKDDHHVRFHSDSVDRMVFDSGRIVKQLTSTPSTVQMRDESFWSDQYAVSPVPLSPFSPMPPSSVMSQHPSDEFCQPEVEDVKEESTDDRKPDASSKKDEVTASPKKTTKPRPSQGSTGASPATKRRKEGVGNSSETQPVQQ
jgi:hypothetical protein